MTASQNISVLAYNIENAFGRPKIVKNVLTYLNDVDPDIAVFCEAYLTQEPGASDAVLEDLEHCGYKVAHTEQELGDNPRPDAHGLVAIARDTFSPLFSTVDLISRRVISRRVIRVSLADPVTGKQFELFGKHASDLREYVRVVDAASLIGHMTLSDNPEQLVVTTPTLIAGDMNSVRSRNLSSRLIRAGKPFVKHLPASVPHEVVEDPEQRLNLLKRCKDLVSYAQRASEMVDGKPFVQYANVGIHDLDLEGQPTVSLMGFQLQLDHILASYHFTRSSLQVGDGVTVNGSPNGQPISMHKPILARVSF